MNSYSVYIYKDFVNLSISVVRWLNLIRCFICREPTQKVAELGYRLKSEEDVSVECQVPVMFNPVRQPHTSIATFPQEAWVSCLFVFLILLTWLQRLFHNGWRLLQFRLIKETARTWREKSVTTFHGTDSRYFAELSTSGALFSSNKRSWLLQDGTSRGANFV